MGTSCSTIDDHANNFFDAIPHSIGQPLGTEELGQLWSHYDVDGNNTLDAKELKGLMTDMFAVARREVPARMREDFLAKGRDAKSAEAAATRVLEHLVNAEENIDVNVAYVQHAISKHDRISKAAFMKYFDEELAARIEMRDIASVQERIKRVHCDSEYELGEELGSGVTAIVYQAFGKNDDKEYAVKMIEKSLAGDIMNDKEIAVMLKVDSPYCVKLYEVFETETQVQLVLELMPGHELFSRITDRVSFDPAMGFKVPFSEAECGIIVKRVALAVAHLHSRGIIHRDLKPENILCVDPEDDLIVKVADFGLAKLFPHDGMRQSTGTHVGTPGYAPPEILNHDLYTYNVDVWTLGICMYIILTGCPPFKQDMKPMTQEMIRNADKHLYFPESHFGSVSESAKDFMRHCIQPNPRKRPTIEEALAHPWLASVILEGKYKG